MTTRTRGDGRIPPQPLPILSAAAFAGSVKAFTLYFPPVLLLSPHFRRSIRQVFPFTNAPPAIFPGKKESCRSKPARRVTRSIWLA